MVETNISFIIVNWNTRDLLLRCVAAIYDTVKQIPFEIILVDNGSRDGSIEAVGRRFPDVTCIANIENKGFAAANNQAFEVMSGQYAVLVNTDVMLLPGAMDALHEFMESHPEGGMACGQLLNPDGSKQNSHAGFPSLGTLLVNESLLKWLFPRKFPSKYHPNDQPIEVDSCIGACMIIRREAMDQAGFFDERYFFFFEETDWARRFRDFGWGIYFIPDARMIHDQGQSAGSGVAARKLFYFSRYQYLHKWHPKQYPFMKAVLILRLVLNVLVNTIVVGLSLGLMATYRFRCMRYWQLLFWHLKGCPFPVDRPDQPQEKYHG